MSYEFIDTAAAALTTTVVDSMSNISMLEPAMNAKGTDYAGDMLFLEETTTHADMLFIGEEGDALNSSTQDSSVPQVDDPIIVIGTRDSGGGGGGGAGGASYAYYYGGYTYSTGEPAVDGNTPTPTEPVLLSAPPPDQSAIEIKVNIDPLTEAQKVLIEKFKVAVENATTAIRALDNELIQMKDGSIVLGSELKRLWALIDFVINPKGFNEYANGSTRGEADYMSGNPQVSFNIDIIDAYEDHGAAGLNFLLLHELGHSTSANRAFDGITSNPQIAVEEMANDIARAIAHDARIPILGAGPTITYSTEVPLVFGIPDGGDDDENGGGGGGSGGEYDDQPI